MTKSRLLVVEKSIVIIIICHHCIRQCLDGTDVEKCGGEGWFSDPSTTQCYFVRCL